MAQRSSLVDQVISVVFSPSHLAALRWLLHAVNLDTAPELAAARDIITEAHEAHNATWGHHGAASVGGACG